MLKPLLFVSAVVLLGITASSAPGPLSQDAAQPPAPVASGPKNPVRPTERSQARAKEIYNVDCAICHNANGDGKTDLASGMDLKLGDLTDPKTLVGKSDAELFNFIRNGKDKMPAEGVGRAKDDELWNLVIYIRGLSKNHPAEAPKPEAPKPDSSNPTN
jgi:mono/diheme cytochrome c family protein